MSFLYNSIHFKIFQIKTMQMIPYYLNNYIVNEILYKFLVEHFVYLQTYKYRIVIDSLIKRRNLKRLFFVLGEKIIYKNSYQKYLNV